MIVIFFGFFKTILWEIVTSVWEFYMLNVKYWRIFLISLLARVFIVSFDRAYREVYTKKYWKVSVLQFLWYDCTFKNLCTVPVTLTFDLWRSIIFFVNWLSAYTVQITFIFIGQTHLVFGKRVCTCVTKHSNAFRTFLNWLKNSKRVWHERKLHIMRVPLFANFDQWSVSVGLV